MSLRSEVVRIFNELIGNGKKITEMPDATLPLTGNELLECVQNGVNSKITANDLGSGGGDVFASDPTLVLPTGFTFGKYNDGDTPAWTGLTAVEAILDALIDYINPAFTSFSVSGQSTTVEVGTTLSGSKTFTWAITLNSGTVATIDIYDNTAAATLLLNTPNDGSQSVTITTIQLNTNGATQSWKGILHDTGVVQDINSSNFVVTARFLYFYGPASSLPANSAAVRALPSSAFRTGASSVTLNTGTTEVNFIFAIESGAITSVIDTTALNAVITSSYVLTGTISVLDAGGTSRTYNLYKMTIGASYASNHAHLITFS